MQQGERRGKQKGRQQREAEGERVLDLVVRGWTHRQIAAELGMSLRTVAHRQEDAIKRKMPVTVSAYRDVMNEQLDNMMRLVVEKAAAGDISPLDAVDRMVKISDRKAKLNGVDAPVQAEVTVTQVTQQEKELQALLEAAAASVAAREKEMTADV